ncbi:ABC transporter substrate-binding protein [Pseudoduganella lutea]|uniref:Branched-chain amino acid ABC transporter substrate-binding protein n=1 Tax=Pseudoduganella lutea TaxID=321985 RepID=A0A4P6L469_9BURK|nr:ABC transporter substrate-binding protein [Pseudoduganella lutea]QBE66381.1 branched-chain amino acid ABC transporter substrate-binding protein [Pseudoduganella lutea]
MRTPASTLKIGHCLPLTGSAARAGRSARLASSAWHDDVNARGGLLGRRVEFVCHDTQSDDGNIAGLYRRLMDEDKADLLLAQGAAAVASALPLVAHRERFLLSLREQEGNAGFPYDGHFSLVHAAYDRSAALTEGFFELASAQQPPPRTVGFISADADFARDPIRAAKAMAAKFGLDVVHDATYPLMATDFRSHVANAVRAGCDVLVLCSYLDDGMGLVEAIRACGGPLSMVGGVMVGFAHATVRQALGTSLAGFVNCAHILPASTALPAPLERALGTSASAASLDEGDTHCRDSASLAYLQLQVLEQAVLHAGGIDKEGLAASMRSAVFDTLAGNVGFDRRGEWKQAKAVQVQYQPPGNGAPTQVEIIVAPPALAAGRMLYPFSERHRWQGR